MLISVNAKENDVPEESTLERLIESLALTEKRVAVEVNQELVVKRQWPEYKLKPGDRVEIVSFVGGG